MIIYLRPMTFIYFISYYKLMVIIYITTFIIFISKTHDNYLSYKPIMIIYRKTHENITLFYCSGCYHILFETCGYFIYLKPMVNIILKKYWRSLFKRPKENIIYKIIHGKNYEKPFKLLFKAHGN